MAPSSSGGTTVGEALNILAPFELPDLGSKGNANNQSDGLHHYLEATALAFADRAKYVGDPNFVDVPTEALLDDVFGKERACEIDPRKAAVKPVAAGDVENYDGTCDVEPAAAGDAPDTENINTTNLTVSDKWGNVVEYTLTIEQTGGSGIVVPGRGFILNNELTDFSTVYKAKRPQPHPARQAAPFLDVAHHRAQGWRPVPGPRLARRLDHHHHGAADADEQNRPRHEH